MLLRTAVKQAFCICICVLCLHFERHNTQQDTFPYLRIGSGAGKDPAPARAAMSSSPTRRATGGGAGASSPTSPTERRMGSVLAVPLSRCPVPVVPLSRSRSPVGGLRVLLAGPGPVGGSHGMAVREQLLLESPCMLQAFQGCPCGIRSADR